ncbi:MAG: phosphate propanoyltransferase [Clostridia bacterium]|nr:phosphate propanoyltransferase [Clostridia bacterium]
MDQLKVTVETSARHVHLSPEHMDILFGEGVRLTEKRALSQPGQFLANERVSIVGGKKRMDNVGIIGPERKASQIEISLTDARSLGVDAPVRESGDIAGTGAIRIEGPCGYVEVSEGVISAKRHIHLTPETAEKYGLTDKQNVTVRVEGPRALIFDEVVVRVSPTFADAMHIDVDEANACCGATVGVVIK